MNKNVEQLWNKAAELTAAFPSGNSNSWQTQVQFINRLVQLTVLEVIAVAPHIEGIDYIKQHFGVYNDY